MIEWMNSHETALWWLAFSSMAVFLVTLVGVPLVIIRLPQDYFVRKRKPKKRWITSHPALKGFFVIVKNIFGLLLVIAGIIMLLTPGQGLFTIFVGMLLMNFPGKYRLVQWLLKNNQIQRSANWLRRRAGRSPFIFQQKQASETETH